MNTLRIKLNKDKAIDLRQLLTEFLDSKPTNAESIDLIFETGETIIKPNSKTSIKAVYQNWYMDKA